MTATAAEQKLRIVRARPNGAGDEAAGRTTQLPPDLVETGAARLGWIALAFAIIAAAMYVTQRLLLEGMAGASHNTYVCEISSLVLIALSVTLVAVQRRGLVAARTLVLIGLGYQVVVAFFLGNFENMIAWQPDEVVRGISWIAPWNLLFALLVPMKPWMAVVGALGSASMFPLAHAVNAWVAGFSFMPPSALAMRLVPLLVMSAVACVLNRKLFRLEVDVRLAREMGGYELEQPLGYGGMGEVWRAKHRMLRREAAVKLIRNKLLVAQEGRAASMMRRRFEREAQATALLRSPHTVELYDFGVAEDGSFYYVMELLDGIGLDSLVARFGPQPAGRVIQLMLQACDSLAEAHQLELIHRDIKPSNLFVCRMGLNRDFLKVLDFGLVKNVTEDSLTRLTGEGVTTGTPAFMSPEVAGGEAGLDGRADLYALGCVAYWLLTGHLVFEETSPLAMVLAHMQKTPAPPSLRTEMPIPATLERAILACLEKDPENRPASARALARTLTDCLQETEPWTREEAERWWQVNLPSQTESSTGSPDSSLRVGVAAL